MMPTREETEAEQRLAEGSETPTPPAPTPEQVRENTEAEQRANEGTDLPATKGWGWTQEKGYSFDNKAVRDGPSSKQGEHYNPDEDPVLIVHGIKPGEVIERQANGAPHSFMIKGEKYYAPGSTMFERGFRTEKEYTDSQRSSGTAWGTHTGHDIPEGSVIIMQGGKPALRVTKGSDIEFFTRHYEYRIPVKGVGGKEILLTPKEADHLGELEGKEQYREMMRLNIIPKGSEYVTGKDGQWHYVPVITPKEKLDRRLALQVLANYRDKEGKYDFGELLSNKNERVREAAMVAFPDTVREFYKNNRQANDGTWVSKDFADTHIQLLNTREWMLNTDFNKLDKDQQVYLMRHGIEKFNAIKGQPLPEDTFVKPDNWIRDYFNQQGWDYKGDNWLNEVDLKTEQGQKDATLYGDRYNKAQLAYQDSVRPKISQEEFISRYARDKKVNLNLDRAFTSQAELDKVDGVIRDAIGEYTKTYGARAEIATLAGTAGEMIAPALRAIKPEVSIKDISGSEWAITAAMAALYAAAPATSAITGLSTAHAGGRYISSTVNGVTKLTWVAKTSGVTPAQLGQIVEQSLRVAAGTTLVTVAASDNKMSLGQRAIYGAIGASLVIANGKAILDKMIPTPKPQPTIENILEAMTKRAEQTERVTTRQLTDRILSEYNPDLTKAEAKQMDSQVQAIRQAWGNSLAGKYHDYSQAQQNLLAVAQKKAQLETEIPQAESYLKTIEAYIKDNPKSPLVQDMANELTRYKMGIIKSKGELQLIDDKILNEASKQVAKQGHDLIWSLKGTISADDFERLSTQFESYPESVKSLFNESSGNPKLAEMTRDLTDLRATIAAKEKVLNKIADKGIPTLATDEEAFHRYTALESEVRAAKLKEQLLSKQISNDLFAYGRAVKSNYGGTAFNYGDKNPSILVKDKPTVGSTSTSVELRSPIPWRTEGIIDAVSKASIAIVKGGKPETVKEFTQTPEIEKIIQNNPDLTPSQIRNLGNDLLLSASNISEFIRKNGLENKNSSELSSIIQSVIKQNASNENDNQNASLNQTQSQTQTKTQTQVTTQTKIDTQTDTPTPDQPTPLPTPKKHPKRNTSAEEVQSENEGAIALRQGELNGKDVNWMVRQPYKQDDVELNYGKLPAGVTSMPRGKGSAKRSVRMVSGKAPKKLTMDVGAQDAIIKGKGKKVTIEYEPDPKMKTKSDITLGKHKVKVGVSEEILPIKRGKHNQFNHIVETQSSTIMPDWSEERRAGLKTR